MLGVQPAWSGNTVLAVDRITEDGTAVFAGELLQPGEVVLTTGDTYTTPWIVITACNDGLDGVAHSLHAWERSLPAHPASQPVTLNVWEALYFDQDPDVVLDLVGRAARLGVERFVLDDGWFHARRTDTAGLGDWWVDRSVWPDGLKPLADAIHDHGMQFGLWFEPEMVNPDSDLYREHPDWVLQATGRLLPPPGHAARALPEHPVGILRVGRRPHRSGCHRARRARLDLGHDRCPVPPTYPTVACGCASPGWTRRRTTG